MENKTFYFMGGLPRSGSTLLTAILNQHPKIYASPQSNFLDMYLSLEKTIYQSTPWNTNLRKEAHKNVLNNLGNLYYSDIDKPIIIDKDRGWGTPGNNPAANSLSKNQKTILVLRPILEVLASFIKLAENNPNNFIDKDINSINLYVKYYRELNDVRCDYLMLPNNEIDRTLLAIATLLNNPGSYHIVWYNDLITNTQKTLDKIYNFLGIENYIHNLNNIQQLDEHDDFAIFGIKDLHAIKKSIQPSQIKPEIILSDYVINKYGNALDFIPKEIN